jgi:hypothetical protein
MRARRAQTRGSKRWPRLDRLTDLSDSSRDRATCILFFEFTFDGLAAIAALQGLNIQG